MCLTRFASYQNKSIPVKSGILERCLILSTPKSCNITLEYPLKIYFVDRIPKSTFYGKI